ALGGLLGALRRCLLGSLLGGLLRGLLLRLLGGRLLGGRLLGGRFLCFGLLCSHLMPPWSRGRPLSHSRGYVARRILPPIVMCQRKKCEWTSAPLGVHGVTTTQTLHTRPPAWFWPSVTEHPRGVCTPQFATPPSSEKTSQTRTLDAAGRARLARDDRWMTLWKAGHKKMRMRCFPTPIRALCVALASLVFFGCGYSQEEWDQKVRENEQLRNQLAARQQAHQKCETDLSDALAEVDSLKSKLNQRGLSIDNLSADLEQQRKAVEEYRRRAEQLDKIRQRFEQLRAKLQRLTQLGLKVEVRNNRMVIQMPGDVLFDSGQ